MTFTPSSTGTHTITAAYAGDSKHLNLSSPTTSGTIVVHGGVTVTAATGGTNISQETAASGGAGVTSYTVLTGPTLTEGTSGDFVANKTLVITAPSGFAFNTGQAVTFSITGSNCFSLTPSSATPTSSTITFTVQTADTGAGTCSVTFSGIQVRPTTFTTTSGTLSQGGTGTLLVSPSNLGSLSEVASVASWSTYGAGCSGSTVTTFSGATNTVCAKGTSYTPTSIPYQIAWYDGANAKVTADSNTTASGGTLTTGDHALNQSPWMNGTAGTWHAVVYLNSATAPTTYTAGGSARADATFTVQSSALPALPTPVSAVLASIGSAGAYWAMRRRCKVGRI